ncbi:MAG: hypothetical protein PSV13_01380 [Lacunisphaera sp.]|nr:hypothetical protein [Lacunisphaera sp.]
MLPRHRRLLLVALLLAVTARAAEEPAAAGPAKATDDDLRIRGVFNSVLPRTEKKNSLRLIVHPHLGDLFERSHLRSELGVRYGLTRRWEVTAEVDSYFSHGLKEKAFFADSGFSEIHLGTKYQLGDPFRWGWETAVGLDWSRPLGSPPPDVTDGLRHIAPYLTFSRQLVRHPAWRVFFGGVYEDLSATGTPGILAKNQLSADNVGVSGGFLYTRGTVTYTFEAAYNTEHPTEDLDGEIAIVRPGIVWVVPARYTFGARGQWLLGFSLKLSHGHNGYDIGAGAKLRVNFDFKRLLGRKKPPAFK